jgi:hypothetical protein
MNPQLARALERYKSTYIHKHVLSVRFYIFSTFIILKFHLHHAREIVCIPVRLKPRPPSRAVQVPPLRTYMKGTYSAVSQSFSINEFLIIVTTLRDCRTRSALV